MKPLVSIVCWRNYAETSRFIRQLYSIGISNANIIVIDNTPVNETGRDALFLDSEIRVIQSSKNNGFASGHKIAADYAIRNGYELLWIVNPDIEINKSTLGVLLDAYERKGPAIFGSVSVNEEHPDFVEFGGAYEISKNRNSELRTQVGNRQHFDMLQSASTHFDTYRPASVFDRLRLTAGRQAQCDNRFDTLSALTQADSGVEKNRYDIFKGCLLSDLQEKHKLYEVGAVEGFSMLIPIDVIKKHGFMDTRFFMYGEETEYCLRLRKEGVPSYIVPSSVVIHKGEGSFGGTGKKNPVVAYYRARNYRLIAKKYFGLTNREIIKSIGGLKAIVRFMLLWPFLKRIHSGRWKLDYFHNLGVLHALACIRGKRIKPEKYLL